MKYSLQKHGRSRCNDIAADVSHLHKNKEDENNYREKKNKGDVVAPVFSPSKKEPFYNIDSLFKVHIVLNI